VRDVARRGRVAGVCGGGTADRGEARRTGCRWALLTDGSPSCGSSFVYSGRFDGVRRAGRGVVAEALLASGIAVFTPADIEQLAKR
jgi:uncharacterized protein YbbK (DUF523 family)